MTKLEKFMVLIFALVIGVFLGYFWRIQHEVKNFEKWYQNWRKEFVAEFWNEVRQGKTFVLERQLMVIPRKDGAITIRKVE